jgi:hypothetical protein
MLQSATLALAAFAGLAAAPLAAAHADFAPIDTNVCGVNWYYCPRDPGCKSYTMSVHAMNVHTDSHPHVEMDALKAGDQITVQASGVTTIEKVPTAGSYRIYALDGKNVATGILSDTMNITYNSRTLQYDFVLTIPFVLDADNFDAAKKWTEWTLDVFQEKSGSDEGMCVEFADAEYLKYEEAKPDPPFVDLCVDNGDGTFKEQTIKISDTVTPKTLHAIAAPACTASPCDLKWNWCPRDPGCKTYTMNVATVETDVSGAKTVKAGDGFTIIVRGTTSMEKVPIAGSYRIYALTGGNVATGVLTDVLKIDRGTFVMTIPFTASENCFDTSKNWFEFGIDVFQAKSGSDEGMCIEITNPTYNAYEAATLSPPFVTDCDMTSFPFKDTRPKGTPEVTHDVTCKFVR